MLLLMIVNGWLSPRLGPQSSSLSLKALEGATSADLAEIEQIVKERMVGLHDTIEMSQGGEPPPQHRSFSFFIAHAHHIGQLITFLFEYLLYNPHRWSWDKNIQDHRKTCLRLKFRLACVLINHQKKIFSFNYVETLRVLFWDAVCGGLECWSFPNPPRDRKHSVFLWLNDRNRRCSLL